jgi:hypothetical protein
MLSLQLSQLEQPQQWNGSVVSLSPSYGVLCCYDGAELDDKDGSEDSEFTDIFCVQGLALESCLCIKPDTIYIGGTILIVALCVASTGLRKKSSKIVSL